MIPFSSGAFLSNLENPMWARVKGKNFLVFSLAPSNTFSRTDGVRQQTTVLSVSAVHFKLKPKLDGSMIGVTLEFSLLVSAFLFACFPLY